MNKKAVMLIVPILLLAAGGGGYLAIRLQNTPVQTVGTASGDPVPVSSVASIAGVGVGINNRYVGVVEAQDTWKVDASGDRTVAEVYVSVGDHVEMGDALFSYDTAADQESLEQQQIELERIENEIELAGIQLQELNEEKASASADMQLSYTTQILTTENSLKREEYEKKQAELKLKNLQEKIENCVVTSDIEGTVKAINSNENEDVLLDSTEKKEGFISILSDGELRIRGRINEYNVNDLISGDSMTITSRTDETKHWYGTMNEIDYSNPDNATTVTVVGQSTVSSSDSSSWWPFYVSLADADGLLLGQHVYLEKSSDGAENQKDGIWLPKGYVNTEASFVWAVSDHNTLEKRAVQLGDYDELTGTYEICSGLSLSDRIACQSEGISEGRAVTVLSDEAAESPTGAVFTDVEEVDEGSKE